MKGRIGYLAVGLGIVAGMTMCLRYFAHSGFTDLQTNRVFPSFTQDDLRPCVAAGIESLCRKQGENGSWTDFDVSRVGRSNVWVTAVVTCSLAESGSTDSLLAKNAVDRGLAWLAATRQADGWGYSTSTGSDADSTAWALRSGVFDHGIVGDRLVMHDYQQPNGGIATYNDLRKGRWANDHPDVTANVVLSLRGHGSHVDGISRSAAIRYLSHCQHEDGSWEAFWWASPFYATCLAGECLLNESRVSEVRRAVGFIVDHHNADGGWGTKASNTVDTAMCTRFLLLVRRMFPEMPTDCYLAGIDWLRRHQVKSGAWPASNLMVLPSPFTDAQPREVLETEGVFSTAIAILSLNEAMKK